MLPDSVRDISEGLDAGSYDADTLTGWYWRLHEQFRMAGIREVESVIYLMHEVTEAMSKCLPPITVDVERIVPSKECLDWHRLERTKVDDPDPVVVLGELKEGKLKLLDGHHRVAKSKATKCETLPAVFATPPEWMDVGEPGWPIVDGLAPSGGP